MKLLVTLVFIVIASVSSRRINQAIFFPEPAPPQSSAFDEGFIENAYAHPDLNLSPGRPSKGVSSSSFNKVQSSEKSCTTIEGGAGECRTLKDCDYLKNLLNKGIAITSLFDSNCAGKNKFFRVCCPRVTPRF